MYTVTALKHRCIYSDRLLSAVVDGTQLKLQQQMKKALQRSMQGYFRVPGFLQRQQHIYDDVLEAEAHIYLLLKHILGSQEREAHGFPTLHLGEF